MDNLYKVLYKISGQDHEEVNYVTCYIIRTYCVSV